METKTARQMTQEVFAGLNNEAIPPAVVERIEGGETKEEAIGVQAALLIQEWHKELGKPEQRYTNGLPVSEEDRDEDFGWCYETIEECITDLFDSWCRSRAEELAAELEIGDHGNRYGVLYGDDDLIVWASYSDYHADKEATLACDRRKVPSYLTKAIRSLVDDCN